MSVAVVRISAVRGELFSARFSELGLGLGYGAGSTLCVSSVAPCSDVRRVDRFQGRVHLGLIRLRYRPSSTLCVPSGQIPNFLLPRLIISHRQSELNQGLTQGSDDGIVKVMASDGFFLCNSRTIELMSGLSSN